MKVYLAGPMRGYDNYNFPAFTDACAVLRIAGYEVFSPHERDLAEGFDPTKTLNGQGFDLRAALLWDMEAVLSSDAVAVMPGWQDSRGARAEVALAEAAGIPWMTVADAVKRAA